MWPSKDILENSVWVFDLGDFLAFEKRTEYIAILAWGIVLMSTGGISWLKVLKCLNPLRSSSLQLREAAQMLFYHPLHGEILRGCQSFVMSKWIFQSSGRGSLWWKSLYLGGASSIHIWFFLTVSPPVFGCTKLRLSPPLNKLLCENQNALWLPKCQLIFIGAAWSSLLLDFKPFPKCIFWNGLTCRFF